MTNSNKNLETVVETVIEDNADVVESHRNGEDGALNFLVGQVMQKTGGKSDPGEVNQLLREKIGNNE